MPYIEDVLKKQKLEFEFKRVELKWGVFETIIREGVSLEVGCVSIGTVADCRMYVEQRRSKQALKQEEMRGMNPYINPQADGVISVG